MGMIIMSNSKIPRPTEISAENIMKPNLDDLLADQRQAIETVKKQRQEQLDALEQQIGRAHV